MIKRNKLTLHYHTQCWIAIKLIFKQIVHLPYRASSIKHKCQRRKLERNKGLVLGTHMLAASQQRKTYPTQLAMIALCLSSIHLPGMGIIPMAPLRPRQPDTVYGSGGKATEPRHSGQRSWLDTKNTPNAKRIHAIHGFV